MFKNWGNRIVEVEFCSSSIRGRGVFSPSHCSLSLSDSKKPDFYHRPDHGREPSTAWSGSLWPERKQELVYWCRRRGLSSSGLRGALCLPARRSPMFGRLQTTDVYDTNGEGSVHNRWGLSGHKVLSVNIIFNIQQCSL